MAGQLTWKAEAISPADLSRLQTNRTISRRVGLESAARGSPPARPERTFVGIATILGYRLIKLQVNEGGCQMAAPLMHSVTIDAKPEEIYEAISTGEGLASFWTGDSEAEPKVGSIARFGFGGPELEMRVEELQPGKLVRWSTYAGFPGWDGTTITGEIVPSPTGAQGPGST